MQTASCDRISLIQTANERNNLHSRLTTPPAGGVGGGEIYGHKNAESRSYEHDDDNIDRTTVSWREAACGRWPVAVTLPGRRQVAGRSQERNRSRSAQDVCSNESSA